MGRLGPMGFRTPHRRRSTLDRMVRTPLEMGRGRSHTPLRFDLPLEKPHPVPPGSVRSQILLFIAQGFGIGKIPYGPGTFGSLLGLLWFAILLSSARLWVLTSGICLGIALSIWLCGEGEKILKQTDPGSIVLDEIAAMPLCFCVWVALLIHQTDKMPKPEDFFASGHWVPTLAVFAAFRFFDILKPWPIRKSQKLPGGWGVTVDDLLAAVY